MPQELRVASRGVFRGELDVVGERARQADRVHRNREAVRARHPELALEVQVGGRDEDVDALALGGLECPRGALDVGPVAAGERRNHRTLHMRGDGAHRFGVGLGGDRKAGLDVVHPQGGQLTGHLQLLVDPHREAGRLFAVAERGVENDEPVSHSVLRGHTLCNPPLP